MRTYDFNINGIDIRAQYSDESIREIFVPLLDKLEEIRKKKGSRVLAMIAAPPGAGKSTLADFLKALAGELGIEGVGVIGMDGFHRRQEYIDTHTMIRDGREILMAKVKGAHETFDLEALALRLKKISNGEKCGWPVYDRILHDPVDDAFIVDSDIVILEGNYLLLDIEGWNDLTKLADLTIFVSADEDMLKKRLIDRRLACGYDRDSSERFVEYSDMYNVRFILEHSKRADINLRVCEDGGYEVVEQPDNI